MIVHIRMFNFDDDEHLRESERMFQELPARIPEIRDMAMGVNMLESEGKWDFGYYMKFDSLDDLRVYQKHEAHAEVAGYVREHHSARAALDFEI